ncbi:MAG: hypothetical protein Q8P59_14560, partial [Dehalococcoidia bacterium]|nr:hypothetical protein [Dehalococcoidia bacterium]
LALYGGYAEDRFAGYWERGLEKPLMINEWCLESLDYADERKFFWTVLTSGGHGVRGCWQPFSETASLPWLRNIADFLDGTSLGRPVDLGRMRPSRHLARLIDVPPGYHVLTLAGVGEEYLIYIRAPQDYQSLVERGQIELDILPGTYNSFWYDPKSGVVLASETLTATGYSITLTVFPHQEDVILYLLYAP